MICVTEKEKVYLKKNKMYQLLLESGGYITIDGYVERGNLNEHVDIMWKCLIEDKNCFLREKDQ